MRQVTVQHDADDLLDGLVGLVRDGCLIRNILERDRARLEAIEDDLPECYQPALGPHRETSLSQPPDGWQVGQLTGPGRIGQCHASPLSARRSAPGTRRSGDPHTLHVWPEQRWQNHGVVPS